MKKISLFIILFCLGLFIFSVKDASAAPSAIITTPSSSTYTVPKGTTLTLIGKGTPETGKNITSYEWRYYSTSGTVVSTTTTFTNTFTSSSRKYYFRVKDNTGAWSAFRSVTIDVLAPPSANSCQPCDAYTKKIDIGWYNYGRTSGTTRVHVGSSTITVPSSSSSYTYNGFSGRNYDVYISYTEDQVTAYSDHETASCYSCIGTIPAHSSVCSNMCNQDDSDVTTNTSISLVGNDRDGCTTSRKCEYTCDPGYMKSGSVCVPEVITPTITISAVPTAINIGQSTTVSWRVNDSATDCTASSTSGGGWSGSKSHVNGQLYTENVTPSSLGAKTYTLTCNNSGGTTVETSNSVTVNSVPNVAPTANISSPSGNRTILEGSSLWFSSSESSDSDGSVINYRWRQGICTGTILSTNSSFARTFNTPGSYRIYLEVGDDDGAWSTNCPSILITVTEFCSGDFPCEPPNLNDSCTDGDVLISWSAEAGADRYALEIKSADNPYPTLFTTTTTGTNYTWNGGEDGKTYYYGVVALEPGDPIQYDVPNPSPVVTCNASPTATIDQPLTDQTIGIGNTVNFIGHGDDADGLINSYQWLMGNCNTGTILITEYWWESGFNPFQSLFDYTFNTAGTYTIYLKAMDNQNTWSTCQSRTITVDSYSCQNLPSHAVSWGAEEETGLVSNLDWEYANPATVRNCEFQCEPGYIEDVGGGCTEPICLSIPTNTTPCFGDGDDLTANTASSVTDTCSDPPEDIKCEYTCNEGYRNENNTTCELIPTTRPVNWQEINP